MSQAIYEDHSVLGHPRGLAYLSFTEAWERFSFYGMQALLTLYMVDQALTPGHAEGVLGLAGLRHGLETVFGPLSITAFASQIFGLYTGFVYFTPIIGGWLGDRVLGQKKTVILGAVLMAAGHALMAVESSFLIALLLLILGCGCLKGNISAQVGALYPPDDARKSHGFSLFHIGINIGVFVSPLVCGTLGEVYGWHWGFGAAAAGMLIGLAVYVSGQKYLPPDSVRSAKGGAKPAPLSPHERRVLAALTVVIAMGVAFNAAYGQETNIFSLWARDALDRRLFGWTVPVTWFQALDGAFVVLFIPPILRIWGWQAKRCREPSDLGKIAIGSFLGGLAFVALIAASLIAARQGHASMLWGVACFALFGAGFIYQWPTTLALVSRAAPASVTATMMGVAFLSIFVANYGTGWLGGFYDKMSPPAFWGLHAAISAVGGLLTLLVLRPLNRVMIDDGAADAAAVEEALTETV